MNRISLAWCMMIAMPAVLASEITQVSDPGTTIRFVRVPASSFLMGEAPTDGSDGKESRVRVELSAFWISETEVSWRQFNEVLGGTAADYFLRRSLTKEEAELPATGISYFELRSFFGLLTSRIVGDGVFASGTANLPTEAQWEYVAREGGREFPEGEGLRGFLLENRENTGLTPGASVRPCGYSRPNQLGCKDMLGNIKELCRDVYADRLPGGKDPFVHCADVRNLFFVVRGGAYLRNSVASYGPSFRGFVKAFPGENHVGFRVVWEDADHHGGREKPASGIWSQPADTNRGTDKKSN